MRAQQLTRHQFWFFVFLSQILESKGLNVYHSSQNDRKKWEFYEQILWIWPDFVLCWPSWSCWVLGVFLLFYLFVRLFLFLCYLSVCLNFILSMCWDSLKKRPVLCLLCWALSYTVQSPAGKTGGIQLQFLSEPPTPTQCNYAHSNPPWEGADVLSHLIAVLREPWLGILGIQPFCCIILFHLTSNAPLLAGQLMYLSLKLAVQMFQWVKSDSTSMDSKHFRSRSSGERNSSNSGLLWLWGKYLCFLRLVPKHTGFMGAVSLLASLLSSCRERGRYCSSSHSRKSQQCPELCFLCPLVPYLETRWPSGNQEDPAR